MKTCMNNPTGWLLPAMFLAGTAGAAVIEQTLRRAGKPIWFTGTGLRFRVDAGYNTLSWRRRSGVWSEYPQDHPDRLTGATRLDVYEHPPINPFRHPPWSAFPHIREVDRAWLSGPRRPGLMLLTEADRQRLAIRTNPDGTRDVLLLFEASCNLPWHEFSFFRGDAIREHDLGVHPLREGETWRQRWRLTLCTS